MKNFKVLSIDAWASGIEAGMWEWNSWSTVAQYSEEENGPLNEANALKFFLNEFYSLNERGRSEADFRASYEIDDDQYNLVLVRKSDFMPIYAIEYGSVTY